MRLRHRNTLPPFRQRFRLRLRRPDGTVYEGGDVSCLCEPPFTFQACIGR